MATRKTAGWPSRDRTPTPTQIEPGFGCKIEVVLGTVCLAGSPPQGGDHHHFAASAMTSGGKAWAWSRSCAWARRLTTLRSTSCWMDRTPNRTLYAWDPSKKNEKNEMRKREAEGRLVVTWCRPCADPQNRHRRRKTKTNQNQMIPTNKNKKLCLMYTSIAKPWCCHQNR